MPPLQPPSRQTKGRQSGAVAANVMTISDIYRNFSIIQRAFGRDVPKTRRLLSSATLTWRKGGTMFKLTKLWANLRLRAECHKRPTDFRKTNVGLGAAFALDAVRIVAWRAAAPGPMVGTQEGRVQGLSCPRRRRVPWHSLRRAASRQSALEAAEEQGAMVRRSEDASVRTDLRADHGVRRVRWAGEQQ